MKTFSFAAFIYLVALAHLDPAHAADLEISLGKSQGTANNSISIGASEAFGQHYRWHAGVASLGAPSYDQLATPSAAADDIAAGEGPAPYYWTGSHNNLELFGTVACEFKSGGLTFGLEAGLGIYKPVRHQDISVAGSSENASWSPTITPIIGASIGIGSASLVLSVQQFKVVGDDDYGYFPTISKNVSLRISF